MRHRFSRTNSTFAELSVTYTGMIMDTVSIDPTGRKVLGHTRARYSSIPDDFLRVCALGGIIEESENFLAQYREGAQERPHVVLCDLRKWAVH